MRLHELLEIVDKEDIFSTGYLLAGKTDPREIQRQLSRWRKSGRIVQLRKGLYMLAPPFRKEAVHPFLIANRLVKGSYVSLHSALWFHGMIPEAVQVTTSVTTLRPGFRDTPVGSFSFHKIKHALFHSYVRLEVAKDSWAFVATPEKALCDLVHLTPRGDSAEYLSELRLQNLSKLDPSMFEKIARDFGKPRMMRALRGVIALREAEKREFATQ